MGKALPLNVHQIRVQPYRLIANVCRPLPGASRAGAYYYPLLEERLILILKNFRGTGQKKSSADRIINHARPGLPSRLTWFVETR